MARYAKYDVLTETPEIVGDAMKWSREFGR